MTKYAICPDYFEECLSDNNRFLNVLLKFSQDNPNKILIDADGQILKIYSNSQDPNGLFEFWLNLASDKSSNTLYKVNPQADLYKLNGKEVVIEIAKASPSERNIVTLDKDDYSAYSPSILSNRINLIDSFSIKERLDSGSLRTDYNALTRRIIEKAARIIERRATRDLEDLYNDDFSAYLRDLGYCVADQTRSGNSPGTKNPGELDIMIRSKEGGTPESIIESFIIDSCGEKNAVISSHIQKLLHTYDTSGLKRNFILAFSRAKNFSSIWQKYIKYNKNLNSKEDFTGPHKLISFYDISVEYSQFADIKIGHALHDRHDSQVEIFHIFINTYSS